jgi:hypothetical protein
MPKISVIVSEEYAKHAEFYGRSMASQTRLILECFARSEKVRLAVEDAERERARKIAAEARGAAPSAGPFGPVV